MSGPLRVVGGPPCVPLLPTFWRYRSKTSKKVPRQGDGRAAFSRIPTVEAANVSGAPPGFRAAAWYRAKNTSPPSATALGEAIAMNVSALASSTPKTVQMLGRSSAAAACASRTRRARASASFRNSHGRIPAMDLGSTTTRAVCEPAASVEPGFGLGYSREC